MNVEECPALSKHNAMLVGSSTVLYIYIYLYILAAPVPHLYLPRASIYTTWYFKLLSIFVLHLWVIL